MSVPTPSAGLNMGNSEKNSLNSALLRLLASAGMNGVLDFAPADSIDGVFGALTVNGVNIGGAAASIGTFNTTPVAAGLDLTSTVLSLHAADGTHAGGVSAAAQTFGGAKTFSNGVLTNTVGAASASSLSIFGAPTDASNAIGTIVGSSTALANTAAKLLQIKNNTSEKAYLGFDGSLALTGPSGVDAISIPTNTKINLSGVGGSGATILWDTAFVQLNKGLTVQSQVQLTTTAGNALMKGINGANIYIQGAKADGASSIAVTLDNSVTLANASAKLLSIQNNTVEKAYVDLNGSMLLGGTGLAATPNLKNSSGDFVISSAPGTDIIFVNSDSSERARIKSGSQGVLSQNGYAQASAGWAVSSAGRQTQAFTDASGTPGDAAINTPTGKVAIAISASSLVVTSSILTASSLIFAQIVGGAFNATLTSLETNNNGDGTFTIRGNASASTSAVNVIFWIIN